MRENAEGAHKEIKRFLSDGGGLKTNTVHEKSARPDHGRCRLKVAELIVYGLDAVSILDSGDITNVLSSIPVDKISIIPQKTCRSITVETGSCYPVVGVLKNVPTTVGDHTVRFQFLVVYGAPFDAIIGDPTMEVTKGILVMGIRQAHFTIYGKEVTIPISSNFPKKEEFAKATDSGEFTSSTFAASGNSSSD